jgi:hypothetical protein
MQISRPEHMSINRMFDTLEVARFYPLHERAKQCQYASKFRPVITAHYVLF